MQKFKAEDGAELAYRDEGAGLPLLALAGLTRDGRDFDYLARHLPGEVRFIRLDSRGRGGSQWTGPETYVVPQEAKDALALLDHLGLERAAFVGSSRGGLIAMVIAATQKHRLLGVCLNDVGPVLQRDGLLRIGEYIGITPTVLTLAEIVDRMPATMPGFANVPELRWAEETVRHFNQEESRVGLPYDPALRISFQTAMAGPLPEAWPLFEACEGLPLALIRGAASDVLSRETADEMRRRRPDMIFAEVPDRGHIPFLDEPEAIGAIHKWLGAIHSRLLHVETEGSGPIVG
ncbi:MAG TPA: alpha/beta hydrolase [Rhizobiaceae bacterium]|mgnify:CR=1 FL=1|nr:alpha/beta hydrolase [Rhizobiaceae bacterium]